MKIEVVQGDITQQVVDVIVNPANPALLPGGGACGAIHRAAGPRLAEACKRDAVAMMGLHTGEAIITPGFDLPAEFVIHAVGPVYRPEFYNGTEKTLLRNAYWSSLQAAEQAHCKTIAFPAISTGIYGYPLEEACDIAVKAIRTWDVMIANNIETVYLVAFDQRTFNTLWIANVKHS